MKIIVEIPHDIHLLCLTAIALNSPEYQLLKNGILQWNERNEEVIQILCEAERALAIQKLVGRVCPEGLERIRELPAE